MKLPKRVFVVRIDDDEADYLVCHEDLQAIEDGETVGVYELVEKQKMKVTRTLTTTKDKKSKKRSK